MTVIMTATNRCSVCQAELCPSDEGNLCLRCLLSLGDQPADDPTTIASDRAALVSGHPSRASDIEPAFSTRRFGDYELIEEIARGGMGVVYKARQKSLDRLVAVKMLLFGALAKPEFIKRFRLEAAAAGGLDHPNIVGVHEVGIHEGQHFLVMDYVDGSNLARLIAGQPMPSRRAAAYLKTIAEAVEFAHQRGILHRDLKPSNILIGSDDQPRVADFGLAKRLDGDVDLTLTGQVLGSPNYMPPEQAAGKRGNLTRAADVYSLGAILYQMLTGRPPFQADTIGSTLELVKNAEPLSPRLLHASVPRDLETICLKCLEKGFLEV